LLGFTYLVAILPLRSKMTPNGDEERLSGKSYDLLLDVVFEDAEIVSSRPVTKRLYGSW